MSCRARINVTLQTAPCLTSPKKTDTARNTSGRAGVTDTANTAKLNGCGAATTRKSSLTPSCRHPRLSCTTPKESHPHNRKTNNMPEDNLQPKIVRQNPETPSGDWDLRTVRLLPSRRFRCANCGDKCRSSNADRGKRKYCRACESLIEKCYGY